MALRRLEALWTRLEELEEKQREYGPILDTLTEWGSEARVIQLSLERIARRYRHLDPRLVRLARTARFLYKTIGGMITMVHDEYRRLNWEKRRVRREIRFVRTRFVEKRARIKLERGGRR